MTSTDHQPNGASHAHADALAELTEALDTATRAREQLAHAQHLCASAETAVTDAIDRLHHTPHPDGTQATHAQIASSLPSTVLDGPWATPISPASDTATRPAQVNTAHLATWRPPPNSCSAHGDSTADGLGVPAVDPSQAGPADPVDDHTILPRTGAEPEPAEVHSSHTHDTGPDASGGNAQPSRTGTPGILGIGASWVDPDRDPTGPHSDTDSDVAASDTTAAGTGAFAGTLPQEQPSADDPHAFAVSGAFCGEDDEATDHHTTGGTAAATAMGGAHAQSRSFQRAEASASYSRVLVVPLPLFEPARTGHASAHIDTGGLNIPMYDPQLAVTGMPDIDTTGHLPPVPAASSLS